MDLSLHTLKYMYEDHIAINKYTIDTTRPKIPATAWLLSKRLATRINPLKPKKSTIDITT